MEIDLKLRTRHWMFIANMARSESEVTEKPIKKATLSDIEPLFSKFVDYLRASSGIYRCAVLQVEESDKGVVHIQGFFQLNTERPFKTILNILKKEFPNVFIRLKPSFDTVSAWSYCQKEGDWVGKNGKSHYSKTLLHHVLIRENLLVPYVKKKAVIKNDSDFPVKSGASQVFEYANDSGKSFLDASTSKPSLVSKHLSFYKSVRQASQNEEYIKYRDLECRLYFGETGTGKTRAVYDEFPISEVYSLTVLKNLWFDFYDPSVHKVLLIDDYKPNLIPLGILLRLLHGYPMFLPVKGGHIVANYSVVIITTNHFPHEILTTAPLVRRISLIREYEHQYSQLETIKLPAYELITTSDGQQLSSEEKDVKDLNLNVGVSPNYPLPYEYECEE